MSLPDEFGMLGNLAELERGAVRVKRDQRLPGIGRERMAVECQHHQLPSAILDRRARSRSLGSVVSNVPVTRFPSGSSADITHPREPIFCSTALKAPAGVPPPSRRLPWPMVTGAI